LPDIPFIWILNILKKPGRRGGFIVVRKPTQNQPKARYMAEELR